MVCATTPRLEYVPQVNLSRLYLFRAADALDAGNIIEAGVLLREAVRRQLYAECAWKGCLPRKPAAQRTPRSLLNALKAAGHLGPMGYDWTIEVIETANKCAHCVAVRPSLIRTAIEWWHSCIDADPCGEPKDRPTALKPAEHCDHGDDDDDNEGEEWKAGAI